MTTRQSTGQINDKSCIWCRDKFDVQHKDRDPFRVLEQLGTWYKFVASVPYLEDRETRERLNILVSSTTDPLVEKISYHVRCFKKYMRPVYDPDRQREDNIQNVNYEEVKQKFFRHVYEKLFEEGEVRTLKSLTKEYEQIRLNFGIVSEIKSSYVKDLLIKEFGQQLGFASRESVNKSPIVYL